MPSTPSTERTLTRQYSRAVTMRVENVTALSSGTRAIHTETDSIFAIAVVLFGFDSGLFGHGVPFLQVFAHELPERFATAGERFAALLRNAIAHLRHIE